MTSRALARLAGLFVLWSAVELLERVAYSAGVTDATDATAAVLNDLAAAVDDLQAVDVSDVVDRHAGCCTGGGSC